MSAKHFSVLKAQSDQVHYFETVSESSAKCPSERDWEKSFETSSVNATVLSLLRCKLGQCQWLIERSRISFEFIVANYRGTILETHRVNWRYSPIIHLIILNLVYGLIFSYLWVTYKRATSSLPTTISLSGTVHKTSKRFHISQYECTET